VSDRTGADSPPIREYPNCFGCGQENPAGLALRFEHDGDRLRARFLPEVRHEGWPGIVHGGIIAALLYEIMENLPYHQGTVAMMRGMDARLKAPAKIGQELRVESWLDDRSGREIAVKSQLRAPDGSLIAQGTASLVALDQKQIERLGVV